MNRRQEQESAEKLRRRAVELGEAGNGQAIPELMQLCRHSRPTVRRAAASALGKLSGCADIAPAVQILCDLVRDAHPQVRQYAAAALGRIGDERALPSLRDVANNPNGPEYVLRSALGAIEKVEQAARIRDEASPMVCSPMRNPCRPGGTPNLQYTVPANLLRLLL